MKKFAVALLATTAIATPAIADELMEAAQDMFSPLPSTLIRNTW